MRERSHKRGGVAPRARQTVKDQQFEAHTIRGNVKRVVYRHACTTTAGAIFQTLMPVFVFLPLTPQA